MGTRQLLYPRGLRALAFTFVLILAALPAWVVSTEPALANKSAPEYSLSVVEGADTQPEDSIEHVSAGASGNAEVSVSLTHNGLVVAQDTGKGGA